MRQGLAVRVERCEERLALLVRSRLVWVALGLLLFGAACWSVVVQSPSPLLLAVGLLGGAALTLLALTRPDVGVLLLLFILFTRLSDVYAPADWRPSPTQAAVGVMLLAVLAQRFVLRRAPLRWDRALSWMCVYAAAIALSVIGSVDRVTSAAALVAYLREIAIAFLLVTLITSVSLLRWASWTLVAGGALLSAAAVVQLVSGNDLGGLATLSRIVANDREIQVLNGPIGVDSNYFAQLLVTVVPIALYRAWYERRPALRAVGLGTVMLIGAVIVMTFSRGGLIGLGVVLLLSAASQWRHPKRLAALAVALVPLVLVAPPVYWERVGWTSRYVASLPAGEAGPAPTPLPVTVPTRAAGAQPSAVAATGSSPVPLPLPASPAVAAPTPTPTTELVGDSSLRQRWRLVQIGALMMLEHPLFGTGKGTYYQLYPRYYQRVDPELPALPRGAHNTPVQVAAETGLLGLAVFVLTMVVTVVGARQARAILSRNHPSDGAAQLVQAVEIAIYGYLVTSLFLHDNIYQRCLWLLVALAVAARQIALTERRPEAAPVTRE